MVEGNINLPKTRITKPSWKTRELRNKITGMRFQSFKEENKNKKVSTQDSWITNKAS